MLLTPSGEHHSHEADMLASQFSDNLLISLSLSLSLSLWANFLFVTFAQRIEERWKKFLGMRNMTLQMLYVLLRDTTWLLVIIRREANLITGIHGPTG